ncbi:MAG: MMPL family transporter, partial [Planctomycetota bacterium]|nr:MMPL family transporter [Planctomycetota bacterium]
LYGAQQAFDSTTNRVEDWLPAEFEETKRLLWFAERFGRDELLMVSWDDCTLDDPRLPQLAAELREPVEHDGRQLKFFRQVLTGSDILEAMVQPPLDLKRQQALLRLEGWLIGPDRLTSCLVARISEDGAAHRHAAVEHVYQCAEKICDLPADSVYVAGPSMQSVAIDNASKSSLWILSRLSMLICILLMWFGFRSFSTALMVFVAAVFCQQFSLAIIYFSGTKMDSVLLMVPSLTFVLAVSAGVHLMNYYRDAVVHQGIEGAPARAVRYGWTPCWLSAVTTALGLMSLTVSLIVPIRKFGGYAALGVLMATAVMILVVPSLLQQFPRRRWTADRSDGELLARRTRRWNQLLYGISRCHGQIVCAALVLLVLAGWGVTRIRATARLEDLFRPGARVLQDYQWLETNVGSLVPIEVILNLPKSSQRLALENLRLVEAVRDEMNTIEGIDCTVSAATFAPPLTGAEDSGWRKAAERAVLKRKLQSSLDRFADIGYVVQDGRYEAWRISARVSSSDRVDYGRVLSEMQQKIEPHLQPSDETGAPSISAVYCGGVPLVHKAQDQLLKDLMHSFAMAFVIIAVTMSVLLRSVRAGLVSMIPNALPAILVFGAMGWAGMEIEIGSLLTATAALGIAVDDTLHFIMSFRKGLLAGRTRRQAIRYAYERCGMAMIQTSLICGLGMLVFSLSPFAPIARFGWLMAAMLGAALVGDLIVLPAILKGWLGRAFLPKRPTTVTLSEAAMAEAA